MRRKSRASDEPSPSTDWKKLVEEWVWKRWGYVGIVVLATILVLGMIWWQWDHIVKLPVIAAVVKVISREPLPRADPKRFSIAVAHLEGDANSDLEQILLDARSRLVDTYQWLGGPRLHIMHYDRTIHL